MRESLRSPTPDPDFHHVWGQVKRLTGLVSQHELAMTLGIADSAVTDAKKRGQFPLNWAYRLAKGQRLSLDALLFAGRDACPAHQSDDAAAAPCDSATRIIEEALSDSGLELSDAQKLALLEIVREELRTRALKLIRALKE